MKTCKVRKAFKLLAGFQWSEIKIMSSRYVNSSARYKILPLFTRFDGTFQAKEGGSGEICPTTTQFVRKYFSSVLLQCIVLTCNHDSEFESLLDTLAKNLIGKIRKPHIALHSFSTLLKKNKQPKLMFRHNKTARQQTNRKWKLYLLLLSKFFWSKPSCIHTVCLSRREDRRPVKISVWRIL